MSLKSTTAAAVSLASLLASLLTSSSAFAQEVGAGGTVETQVTTTTTAQPVYSPPPSTTTHSSPTPTYASPSVASSDNTPDHDKVVGHFGVTYFGVSQIPVASQTGTRDNVTAPAIGVRYWLTRGLGIDAGLGFGVTSGSNTRVQKSGGTTTTTDVDAPGRFGFLLHGGVPLALAAGKHYSFQVTPEFNLGVGTGSVEAGTTKTSLTGFKLDIGARVGGEIHFGFIGIPELALQASVGLRLTRDAWKAKATDSATNNEDAISGSTLGFGTTVNGEPWAIFANNISAIYYF